MITKKWVDGKLEAHRKTEDELDSRIEALEKEVGEPRARHAGFVALWDSMFEHPDPLTVYEIINKICEYLGIEIRREKEEKIVAKKIKKAK